MYVSEASRIVAFYGGAFDPVHFGHIKIALHVLAQPEIAQLRLVPCYRQADKSEICASPSHRLRMLEIVAAKPLSVDCLELYRKGVSYTADTADQLRDALGSKVPLAFVLGADAYAAINSWQRAAQLPSLLHLIVVARPKVDLNNKSNGNGWQSVASLQEMARCATGCVHFMPAPLIDISSRSIRSLIAHGEQPRYLIPGTVWSYIRENRLYGYRKLS